MKKTPPKGHTLTPDQSVSEDEVIRKVIAAEARAQELARTNKTLLKDREQLLDEYKDLRDARPVPKPTKTRKRRSKKEDRVRVCVGDVHGMLMDKAAVGAFLEDLKTLDPDEVVLGGDMVECGGWLAKYHTLGYISMSDYTYQEDIQAASWFLDQIQTLAPHAEIHYLEGNHEDRVEKWVIDQVLGHRRDSEFLRDAFAPEFMLRLKERGIHYYRRSENYLKGFPMGWIKLGKMHFTHALTSGKFSARKAVERTAGNVTFFHTHQEDTATVNLPTLGIVKAFNPGCLCSKQPVWKNSDPSNWSHGYGIDIIAKSDHFQRIHVAIEDGQSLAHSMISRFKSA